jgi:deoxyribodipyrimidine photolyase-related protein
LVVVLGDQLDLDAAAFDGFDPAQDAAWMAEVAEESTHVWSSKPRTVLQVKNVARLDDAQKQAIRARAAAIRRGEVA